MVDDVAPAVPVRARARTAAVTVTTRTAARTRRPGAPPTENAPGASVARTTRHPVPEKEQS